MRNGFRSAPQASKKDRLSSLETELKNMSTAARISQMMIQQLLSNMKGMGDDLGAALSQLTELQYKYTALQKHLNLDTAALDKVANEQRLKDFEAGSIAADAKENLQVADVVGADSTITITSTSTNDKGEDGGIFRSRLKLAECGVPDMITALTGKTVGSKTDVKLNGINHVVEILAIRNPVEAPAEQAAPEVTH
jgi:hypothetical protein